jgi:hypothetical protein
VLNATPGTGFTIQFYFSENEFFTDAVCFVLLVCYFQSVLQVLTKVYNIDLADEPGALLYQGPTFTSSTGYV